mgnify:CR=1 FL=1
MVSEEQKQIKQEIKEQYNDSVMTKTGRLAMELNAERARLRQEMEELQVQVEDLSPATPTGTTDAFVKWVATCLAVTGVFTQSAGFIFEGKVAYALSSIAWVWVGHAWNDKAIMIGSAITGTAVLLSLMEYI